ncbi:MAG: TlpA family protein disulfide reductase [Chloroflexota bacterium]
MTPIVNGLQEQFDGRVAVHRIDAAGEPGIQLQSAYEVRGHPSFVVVDGQGQVQERFFGPQEEEVLRAAVNALTES